MFTWVALKYHMPFVYAMWDSESQRIGLQKCTSAGYRLRQAAVLIGLLGLVSFPFLLWKAVSGAFFHVLLWWFALPVGLGLFGDVLMLVSWRMAASWPQREALQRG